MASACTVPESVAISSVLTALFGRDVEVEEANKLDLVKLKGIIATYRDADRALGAFVAADLAAAGGIAAALSLFPPRVVNEAVQAGALPDSLAENLREVLNVGKRWFDSSDRGLELAEILSAPGGVTGELRPYLANPAARLDVEVMIRGYAPGRLTIVSVKG